MTSSEFYDSGMRDGYRASTLDQETYNPPSTNDRVAFILYSRGYIAGIRAYENSERFGRHYAG